jgi:hypothetical protein
MSWKPTVFAFILAIVAVATALLTGGEHRGVGQQAGRGESRPLVSPDELPVDEVTRITLIRHDDQRLVFERAAEGRWIQVEPFEHPLDRFAVRRLITAATEVQVVDVLEVDAHIAGKRTDESPWALADLALDPPEARITYDWAGDSLTIELGRRTVAGRAYLRRSGERYVSVVNQALHRQAVELDPREWRDRTIFTSVGIESDRIIRTVGRARLVIERDRRQWRITEPIQTRVDPFRREQMIQSLASARAGGFIVDQPADLSRFGLDPPVAMIEVVTQAHKSHERLRIGSTAGAGTQDRFGIIEGRSTVIRIPARVWQMLFDHPADIADPTGSGMIAADIKTLHIIGPAGDFRIQRDLEEWRAIDHGGVRVPRGLVDEFLSTLTELRGDDVILQEVYPHDLEVAVVTFYGFDDRPRDTVRVLRDPDTGNWALENGDNVLRVFSQTLPMRLTPSDFGLPE